MAGYVAEEDRYVEIGYIEDQDDYISYGPIVFWGEKVIVIPRNMLTHVNGWVYELDMHYLKKFINYLESNKMGIAHDKILYHETETVISGVTYARKIMFINGYTVTFENGNYGVNLYGANHNLMDVLNLNNVSVRAQNSAGLQTVYTGEGVLKQDERDKLMSLMNLTAQDVWKYPDRTITQQTGLRDDEREKLMNRPTAQDIADAVWSKDLG